VIAEIKFNVLLGHDHVIEKRKGAYTKVAVEVYVKMLMTSEIM